MTSAAYEPVSGKIYYALNTDYRQGMYEIDPATAAATKLYDFYDEESVAGMYFPDTPPPGSGSGIRTLGQFHRRQPRGHSDIHRPLRHTRRLTADRPTDLYP